MTIYIGDNLKRLRKHKNITQERLAEQMSVSCQAVSKWERNESYPDITMLIPLASYFGITTDELLGVNNVKNEQAIATYLSEYDKLSNEGKDKEKCDLIRKAFKEFPNDFRIIGKHMEMLLYDPYIENYKGYPGLPTHAEELEKLCNRVLTECTIDQVRYSAISILAIVYNSQGNAEKALAMLDRFPNGIYYVRGEQYEMFYEDSSKEWWQQIHANIYALSQEVVVKLYKCALYSKAPPQERAAQFRKVIDAILLLFEDDDDDFRNFYLTDSHKCIAEIQER